MAGRDSPWLLYSWKYSLGANFRDSPPSHENMNIVHVHAQYNS